MKRDVLNRTRHKKFTNYCLSSILYGILLSTIWISHKPIWLHTVEWNKESKQIIFLYFLRNTELFVIIIKIDFFRFSKSIKISLSFVNSLYYDLFKYFTRKTFSNKFHCSFSLSRLVVLCKKFSKFPVFRLNLILHKNHHRQSKLFFLNFNFFSISVFTIV